MTANLKVTVNGVTGTVKTLSGVFKVVPWDITYRRIHRNKWPVDKALLTPKGEVLSQKLCDFCNTSMPNNTHTCTQCGTLTYAGRSAELRRSLK